MLQGLEFWFSFLGLVTVLIYSVYILITLYFMGEEFF